MNIQAFRELKDLTQADFAAFLTLAGVKATQSLVSQWELGTITIPAERVIEIERATGGQITRSALRPDLWAAEEAA